MIYVGIATKVLSGKRDEYMEIFSKELLPRYEKVGRKLVAQWRTYIGDTANELVDIWAFNDFSQWENVLNTSRKDEGCLKATRKIAPPIDRESRRVLMPTPYSPLK